MSRTRSNLTLRAAAAGGGDRGGPTGRAPGPSSGIVEARGHGRRSPPRGAGLELAVPHPERFVERHELGRGGMGRVVAYHDRALGRVVARKMLLDPASGDAAALVSEAQICAQLEHPAIVPVYDIGANELGEPHYTMRVIRGRPLREVLAPAGDEPRLGLYQLLGVLRQVCLTVDYAHSRGVVHRDLKPDNIIVGEFGEVYVADWGIAHIAGDARAAAAGSPGYMAPEQAEGAPIDPQMDVYSIGTILDDMLGATCGTPPPELRALARACQARDPGARPSGARAVADALDAFLDGARQREERERAAATLVAQAGAAAAEHARLVRESARFRDEADARLAALRTHDPIELKRPSWDAQQRAREAALEAARAMARAETLYAQALGQVADHPAARAGIVDLYLRRVEDAERRGDDEERARYLDLARAQDDGRRRIDLADEAELSVDAPGAVVAISRYEVVGPLLVQRPMDTTLPGRVVLRTGSYLLTARGPGGAEARVPLVLDRCRRYRLRINVAGGTVPEGMVAIPAGSFHALERGRAVERHLDAFAIARFPVTLAEYVAFLDDLEPPERRRRTPGHGRDAEPILERRGRRWQLTGRAVEGEARHRIPPGRELDLPVHEITWFSALAYAAWRARRDGVPYRLPSSLEWEKAARGADGRPFPMGRSIDASLAKLRDSRPEASQPEIVGAFPTDESPYGVRDLAGGVGDWTTTSPDGIPLPGLEGEGKRENAQRQAIWRGGTWATSSNLGPAMAYAQLLAHPSVTTGLRLAMPLPEPIAVLEIDLAR